MTNLTPQSSTSVPDRIGNFFEDLFEAPKLWNGWYPAVDVKQSDTEMTFLLEAPGVNKEDIEVNVQGDLLTIKGHRKEEKEEKTENYVRRERRSGSFERSFRLDSGLDAEQVKADFRQGVLTITVPKIKPVNPQRIPIN